jgi:23S rRNA pseudouridine1911/1915/1917 synthase
MPEPDSRFQFVANRADARSSQDLTLVRRLTGLSRFSRTEARRWIESGMVSVNGQPVRRAASRVRDGSSVEVRFPQNARLKVRPQAEPGPLAILYEDEGLMVVNKPPGTVVHPSYKRASGTLLNYVLWHLRARSGTVPGVVTRLDRETSGLVLIALTAPVHAALQRRTAVHQPRKTYLAVVDGWPRPASGRIREPLARDPDDRRRVIVAPEGAASETRYEVLARRESAGVRESLVQCELVTGRTHQIRAHLASRGWPIVGDRTYGRADLRIARQALHAWRLSFLHPLTAARIDCEAPLPDDIMALGMVPPNAAR